MHQALAYIRYRRKATTRHGVHSPFVYRLIEKVFKPKGCHLEKELKALRQELLNDHREIEINDLGAGPKNNNNPKRKISEIGRTSATKPSKAALLQRLATYLSSENILELGTNLGLGTAYLASSPACKNLVSIEGDPGLANLAVKNLQKLGLNATILQGGFKDQLPSALDRLKSIDLAYIDGNHRGEATLRYLDQISRCTHQNSVIAVGDIHWSKGMEAAWEEIKGKEDCRMSIDLYYFGLVFFNNELSKQHFILKY